MSYTYISHILAWPKYICVWSQRKKVIKSAYASVITRDDLTYLYSFNNLNKFPMTLYQVD